MGLISSAINSAFESIGGTMISAGEKLLSAGFNVWKSSSKITISYAQMDPMSTKNAWATVTGSIFDTMLAVGVSLSVLFFVLGWLNESVDIRTNFTLEAMFRFFVRYVITASLIVNSLTFAEGITRCATALVSTISVSVETETAEGAFDEMKEELKKDEEADGGTWLVYGFIALAGGLIGCLVIIVCAIEILITVLSRLFKLLLCIPFAPVAFAGFAGGREFSRSGMAWIRTYTGYCLEAVVIVLALLISFGIFHDASAFEKVGGIVGVILQICEYALPMITACACVKTADMVVRRCLGLG